MSIGIHNKGKKSVVAAVMLGAAMMATPAKATSVIAGGVVPVINNLITFGNNNLDIASAATNATVASFFISNNTANTFDLSVVLVNGGEFLRTGQVDGDGLDWSAADLNPGGTGTLGTGATAVNPATTGLITPIAAAGGPTVAVVYDAGAQTTPTTDYQINLRGSWPADATLLAGLYTEKITVTLTAQL